MANTLEFVSRQGRVRDARGFVFALNQVHAGYGESELGEVSSGGVEECRPAGAAEGYVGDEGFAFTREAFRFEARLHGFGEGV